MITEELFYNKPLSDAVRELVKDSYFNLKDAVLMLTNSNNYERDVKFAIRMKEVGSSFHSIREGLIALQDIDKDENELNSIKSKIEELKGKLEIAIMFENEFNCVGKDKHEIKRIVLKELNKM